MFVSLSINQSINSHWPILSDTFCNIFVFPLRPPRKKRLTASLHMHTLLRNGSMRARCFYFPGRALNQQSDQRPAAAVGGDLSNWRRHNLFLHLTWPEPCSTLSLSSHHSCSARVPRHCSRSLAWSQVISGTRRDNPL